MVQICPLYYRKDISHLGTPRDVLFAELCGSNHLSIQLLVYHCGIVWFKSFEYTAAGVALRNCVVQITPLYSCWCTTAEPCRSNHSTLLPLVYDCGTLWFKSLHYYNG
ncbi:hypothetical protein RRG08_019752 [Elysia crispata]|uniref:Uncharacterized protein n=1 Tax=Elysia crispata TaxID=231223 RepID=A0AAE1CUC8_9GAST|nr:hypothetical protein RRG08_019752 [Elysia crispata]